MNLKVDVIESEEGPALGGAMLAAVGCGEYPDVETIAEKLVKLWIQLNRNQNLWRSMKNGISSSENCIRSSERLSVKGRQNR